MKTFEIEIQHINPANLTPYSLNNKTHSIEQIDELAGLISTFGFDQPIVVDENYVIIKGHARREASLRLRLETVPTIVRQDLTDEEKRAARMSDNTITGQDYNLAAIGIELDVLSKKKFDITKLGLNSTTNSTLKGFLESRKQMAEQLEKEKDAEYQEDKEYFGDDNYDGSENENDGEQQELQESPVRMVQLFLNSVTILEFQEIVTKLNEKYKTTNTTDCVMQCLRECDKLS